MIRVLVVDDEALARRGVRRLLDAEGDVQVVGECADGPAALERLEAGGVDLVLLDVQMPGFDGFEVLRRLPRAALPEVVFVTAFDRYALDAFEVHAIDYLLKPVEPGRFRRAIERARARLERGRDEEDRRRLRDLLARMERDRGQSLRRLVVRKDGRARFLLYGEIDWLEAQGNYVAVHAGAETHLVRETMSAMAERLEPHGFARIHRSTIVNLERVREIQPWFKGDLLVVLQDGTELSLTRTYRAALEERLGDRL